MMNQKLLPLPWHSHGGISCIKCIEMGMRGRFESWGRGDARVEHVIGGSWHQISRNFNVKIAMWR